MTETRQKGALISARPFQSVTSPLSSTLSASAAAGLGRRSDASEPLIARATTGWAAQQRFLSAVFSGGFAGNDVRWRFECDSTKDYDYSKNVRME